MGGIGSGGRNRKSEAEKIANGTFRASVSDEAYLKKSAEKIITGVFLAKVTDPQMPMGDVGNKKYFEIATLLLNGNKLTSITRDMCEVVGMMWEKIYKIKSAGKDPPTQLVIKYQSLVRDLRVAEDAPAIANPSQKSRFAGVGFAYSRNPKIRLLAPAAAQSEG